MTQITDKQRCIAEQSVYGDLKISTIDGIRKCFGYNSRRVIYQSNMAGVQNIGSLENIKPILRPLSWLTREITHDGYNDGKPFVPIRVILKNFTPYCEDAYSEDDEPWRIQDIIEFSNYCHVQAMLDLLNRLHFDTRGSIEAGEAVSTEDVGDVYAVKGGEK